MKGISVKIKLQGEKKRHCSLWELSTVMTRAQHRTENQLQCIFSKAGRTSPNIHKSSHGYPETYFSRSKMKSLDEFYLFVRIWRVTIILWGFHRDIVNLFLCLFLLFKKRINTLGWLILCVTCSTLGGFNLYSRRSCNTETPCWGQRDSWANPHQNVAVALGCFSSEAPHSLPSGCSDAAKGLVQAI